MKRKMARARRFSMKDSVARRRGRRRRLRTSVLLGSASLGVFGGLAAHAEAGNNYGGWLYEKFPTYGGMVWIKTPPSASTETVPSDEFVLHRLVSEGPPTQPGLFQTGLYRSGASIQLDNCLPSENRYSYFVEWLDATPGSDYKCKTYGASVFGHVTSYQTVSDGVHEWWGAATDPLTGYNYSWGPAELHWGIAQETAISTELGNASARTDLPNGSTTDTLFAPGHALCDDWCVYLGPFSGSPHVVSRAEATAYPHNPHGDSGSPGRWSIPAGDDPTYLHNMEFKHSP